MWKYAVSRKNMRSVAYSAKRKTHIMRKMRRNRSNVWMVKRKSPHLCGIRYRICRVRYITLRESTHNSKFCAETLIFRAEVHIAQDFAKTLRPSSLYAVWRSILASHRPISRAVMGLLSQHKQACPAFSSTWFNTIHFHVTDITASFAICGRSSIRLTSTSRFLWVTRVFP